jgi:PKD repeat protein
MFIGVKKTLLLMTISFFCILSIISTSEAHVLIIGDSLSDYPQTLQETQDIAHQLKFRGYNVLELYQNNATTKNILKGMYDADAVIYAGHGGYQYGNYDNNGGTATGPFSMLGAPSSSSDSTNFIWGVGGEMREGWTGNLFEAPFKANIPVFLLHACFSTGWVEDKEVSNPVETIYNFSRMFTSVGANYYATAWNGAEIIHDFLSGAQNFEDANQQNYEPLTYCTNYNGVEIWKNPQGYAAFVGDMLGTFPIASQTTVYDDAAAERWYNSNRIREDLRCTFTISTGPYYTQQPVTFREGSYSMNGNISSYFWNFGDGTTYQTNTTSHPVHTYTQSGNYVVQHSVSNDQNLSAETSRIISVNNPPSAPLYTPTPAPAVTTIKTTTTSTTKYKYKYTTRYIYKWVKKGKKWYRIKYKYTYKWVKKGKKWYRIKFWRKRVR